MDEVRIAFTPRSSAWVRTTHNNQSAPGTFLGLASEENLFQSKLAITAVNGGAPVAADTAFSITVQAQTSSGTPLNVTNNTTVTLTVATGSGSLGGTVTGTPRC